MDSLSITHTGIGRSLLFYVPDLPNGLSFDQMVGFSLVHSLLGFLGCESWVRLSLYLIVYPVYSVYCMCAVTG